MNDEKKKSHERIEQAENALSCLMYYCLKLSGLLVISGLDEADAELIAEVQKSACGVFDAFDLVKTYVISTDYQADVISKYAKEVETANSIAKVAKENEGQWYDLYNDLWLMVKDSLTDEQKKSHKDAKVRICKLIV